MVSYNCDFMIVPCKEGMGDCTSYTRKKLASVQYLNGYRNLLNRDRQGRIMNKTLIYYENHAKEFAEMTVNLNFSKIQNEFLKRLKKGDLILDFGCGSGRDSRYFLEQGFQVEAVDGSMELCKLASKHTGIEVKHRYFQELKEEKKYDGIWACSSILHLSKEELKTVAEKMKKALKKQGIIYTSFKYGIFEGERNSRYFTDMTEESFEEFMKGIKGLKLEKQWITSDIRPERDAERWLNVILRKE